MEINGEWVIGTCPDRFLGRFCKLCAAHSRLPDDHYLREYENNPTRRNNVGYFYDLGAGELLLLRFPDSVRKGIALKGKSVAATRPPGSLTDPYRGYDIEVVKAKKNGKVTYTVELIPQSCPMITLPSDGTTAPQANVVAIRRVLDKVQDLNTMAEVKARDFDNIDILVKSVPDLWAKLSPQERAWSHKAGTMGPHEDNSQEPDYGTPESEEADAPPIPMSVRAAAQMPAQSYQPQPGVDGPRPRPAPQPSASPTQPTPQPRPTIRRPPPKGEAAPVQRPPAANVTAAMNEQRDAASFGGSSGHDDDIPF
jgi:hypothetical protein